MSEQSTAEPSASEESDESDPFEVESLGQSAVGEVGRVAPPVSDASHDEGGSGDGCESDVDGVDIEQENEIGVDGVDDRTEDDQLALASCKSRVQGAAEQPRSRVPSFRFQSLEIDGAKAREPLLLRMICRIVDKRRRRSL